MLSYFDKNPEAHCVFNGHEIVSHGHLLQIMCSLIPSSIPLGVKYFSKKSHVSFPLDQWDPMSDLIFNSRHTPKD
jgi:hypothetical protein